MHRNPAGDFAASVSTSMPIVNAWIFLATAKQVALDANPVHRGTCVILAGTTAPYPAVVFGHLRRQITVKEKEKPLLQSIDQSIIMRSFDFPASPGKRMSEDDATDFQVFRRWWAMVHFNLCAYVYIHVYMYICIYIYAYTCIYIYI